VIKSGVFNGRWHNANFWEEPPDPTTDKETAALVAILHAHATIYGSFTVPRVTGPKGGQSATIV
jgi:hypothetical protein